MESDEISTPLLKNKWNLHVSPEVKSASERTRVKTGEKVPQDPTSQITNYLDRFHEITDRTDPERREHGITAGKSLLHRKFVIKPDEIPESYFENQRRLARQLGHGDVEITPEARAQLTEVIIADQKSSLDQWVDYLSSPDAVYSDGLKYYAIRSVLNMGAFDKVKQSFSSRTKETVAPFPDLNREALAYVLDAIDKKYKGYDIDLSSLEETDRKEFEKLLNSENFSRLYVWAIEKVTPASEEQLKSVDGKWVKYDRGSDPLPLVQSLQGHGTGWCTAGESTARTQLEGGDFYIFYSLDKDGKPTVPRIAIRMQENFIAEVRGVAEGQNLDSTATQIVDEKLKEFPDGEAYKKKADDMRQLTEIERKSKVGQELNFQDLRFLYEMDSTIDGFGYQKDPRIEEIRSHRDPEADMPIIFDCEPTQITHNASQINESTKAYLGPLEPGIFTTLQRFGIEYIYTKFPEGKIRFDSITIGGKSRQELEADLQKERISVSNYTKDMIRSVDFTTELQSRDLGLVLLKVGDFGFGDKYPTIDEVYKRAKELGLELCPPEVGPNYRLQYKDQPMSKLIFIGMESIAGSNGNPDVFNLGRDTHGLWLSSYWAGPEVQWHPECEFVFSLKPPEAS